ncbi:MAG TPA: SpoIID/LytB domain-containing protein [Mycobacteriales bacterium]|nr:SpoIID/LytB domain-containing protein [Mycobacteriales bacterium]
MTKCSHGLAMPADGQTEGMLPPRLLMSSTLLAVALPVLLLGGSGSIAGAAASAPALLLEGRGHGHGVGLTHDGALELGRRGESAEQILARFYPGTTIGTARLTARVLVHDSASPSGAVLAAPSGAMVRPDRGAVPGLPLELAPGARLSVSTAGSVVTATVPGHAVRPRVPGLVRITAPGALLVVPDGVSDIEGGGSYRGLLRVVSAAGRLRVVNHVDVESYLRGMGEVRDSSWPAASLRAQAVAARGYAVHAARYAPRDRDFDLYADDRSQVYLGARAEYAAMDRAVLATTGRVLRHEGLVANTVYSTNGGGVTATTVEGFGPSELRYPYLAAVRYPTANADPWTVRLPHAKAARLLGYPGRLDALTLLRRGPSGRAVAVRLSGSAGVRDLTGLDVADRLDLRSTLFDVTLPAGRVAPPPLPRPVLAGSVQAPAPARLAAASAATVHRQRPFAAASAALIAAVIGAGVLLGNAPRGRRIS